MRSILRREYATQRRGSRSADPAIFPCRGFPCRRRARLEHGIDLVIVDDYDHMG